MADMPIPCSHSQCLYKNIPKLLLERFLTKYLEISHPSLQKQKYNYTLLDSGGKWEIVEMFGRKFIQNVSAINNIYVGKHCRSLDEKGRVLLPSKWRFGQDVNDIYVAIQSASGCITVYPPKMVENLSEQVARVSLGDKKGQKILTRLFSQAEQLMCDGQGRISISKQLSSHADLSKDIILVGNFVTFSLWNPERYESYISSDNDEEDDISRMLMQLGL